MTVAILVVVALLLLMYLGQAALTIAFARRLYTAAVDLPPDEECPKVGILMPLRGADPELADGLRRLMQQDYPAYEIQVVIDSPEDSSWDVVRKAMAGIEAEHVHCSSIENRRPTCSPQCSALMQGVDRLADDVEVVVIIDGDVVTHPTWLRQLVAPLRDPAVGIVHGNRWFMPREASLGALVRYVWNSVAVIPMCFLEYPWAGTMSIRKCVLMESGLYESWAKTLVPDAQARDLLAKRGLRIRFAPALMMVNRERCSVAFALDFFKRQMTWTRVYNSQFWPVQLHAAWAVGAVAAGIGLAVAALVRGELGLSLLAWATLVGYYFGELALLALMERSVRHVLRLRDEPTAWLTPLALVKLLVALPLTLVVHFAAICLATVRRRVTFRGVTYQIDGPFDVRIVGDGVFRQASVETSNESV